MIIVFTLTGWQCITATTISTSTAAERNGANYAYASTANHAVLNA